MFTIIGGDGKEYGSVTTDDLQRWIAEGRLNAQSLAKRQGDAEFHPLSSFPEFAAAFATHASGSGTPPPFPAASGIAEGDYDLDIGGCISRGWELLKNHFGVVFVAALLFMLIEGAIGALGAIPIIGPLFSLANIFIFGPLLGGVYYVLIQTIRQQPATAGDVFAGFRKAFLQLFLGRFVCSLLAGLCMIPFLIVMVILVVRMVTNTGGQPSPEQVREFVMSMLPIGLPVLLICLIPTIYLQIRWIFTLPLIIDRQMDFWTAMKISWKRVGGHWWQVFGLVVLVGLLNVVGFCACCVGVLFTVPIGYGALMYAYETIFSGPRTG